MNVDELLDEHTRPIAALTRRLRRLVRGAMPDAEERVHPGWHALGYHHPEAGYVCGLFPRADHVEVVFEHGLGLPDPSGVLTEKRSQVASSRITRLDDATKGALVELIDAAVELRRV